MPVESRPAPVLNIAHRGARAFAPENTLPAFEKAARLGAVMIELDVHLSRDGQVVVHHDDDLIRCTDVAARFPGRAGGFVSDFSLAELSTLDAGSWFVDQLRLPAAQRQPFLRELTDEEAARFISPADRELYGSGTVGVPTLGESLELACKLELQVNIEIKSLPRMYTGLTEEVVSTIESLRLESQVLISSFDHEQLLAVRRRTKNIRLGVLTSDRLARPADYLRLLEAEAYHPSCSRSCDSLGFHSVTGQLDATSIAQVRAAGGSINVWTCNDKEQMRQLIAAGVTGIISDYPNRVQDVLREQPRPA